MNPQDSNTTPSDNPQPNSTPQQEVTVSLGEENPPVQDNSAGAVTPSLSSDQPVADPTVQTDQSQSVAPTNTPGFDTPKPEGTGDYTSPAPGTNDTPSDGTGQPAPAVQPEPYAASQDPAQAAPAVQPEQAPVPGTLPVAPPHSDKKTLVILAGVAVVLIVAIAVLLFM